MRTILPLWVWPLNMFQVRGTLCCLNMHQQYLAHHFMDSLGCYDANSIYEANLLIIWGSLSHRLAKLVGHHVPDMLENRYVIHMRGCNERMDNLYTSSSIGNLAINSVFSGCNLSTMDYRLLKKEARQCLLA